MAGLPNPFSAIRYHSLVVEREGLPDCFEITAWTDDDEIMGLKHREHPVEGIQFHPESIMTKLGKNLLDNFLKPILLGRGAPVPMLVIFLGAIGGFLSMGFIGLFVGAVILSIGFKLFQAWLDEVSQPVTNNDPEDFPAEKSKAVG